MLEPSAAGMPPPPKGNDSKRGPAPSVSGSIGASINATDFKATPLVNKLKQGENGDSSAFITQLLELENELEVLYVLNSYPPEKLKRLATALGQNTWGLGIGLGKFGSPLKSLFEKNSENYDRLVALLKITENRGKLLAQDYSKLTSAEKQQYIIELLRKYNGQSSQVYAAELSPMKGCEEQILANIILQRELYRCISPEGCEPLFTILSSDCCPHLFVQPASPYMSETFNKLQDSAAEILFCYSLLSVPSIEQLDILHRQYQFHASHLVALRKKIADPCFKSLDRSNLAEKIDLILTPNDDLDRQSLTANRGLTEQLLFILLYEKEAAARQKILRGQLAKNPRAIQELLRVLAANPLLKQFERYNSLISSRQLLDRVDEIAAFIRPADLYHPSFTSLKTNPEKANFLLSFIFLSEDLQKQVLAKQSTNLKQIKDELLGFKQAKDPVTKQLAYNNESVAGKCDAAIKLLTTEIEARQTRTAPTEVKGSRPRSQSADTTAGFFAHPHPPTLPRSFSFSAVPSAEDLQVLKFVIAYLVDHQNAFFSVNSDMKKKIDNYLNPEGRNSLSLTEIAEYKGSRTKRVRDKLKARPLPNEDPFVLRFIALYLQEYMKAGWKRNPFARGMLNQIREFVYYGKDLTREDIEKHAENGGKRSKLIVKELHRLDSAQSEVAAVPTVLGLQ